MLTLKVNKPVINNVITEIPLEIPTTYQGLPVVRAPKALGRRGLTNKNIILHPSGIKLSKVPNGYLVLCSYPNCGAIGSKEPCAKDKFCLSRCTEYYAKIMLNRIVIVVKPVA